MLAVAIFIGAVLIAFRPAHPDSRSVAHKQTRALGERDPGYYKPLLLVGAASLTPMALFLLAWLPKLWEEPHVSLPVAIAFGTVLVTRSNPWSSSTPWSRSAMVM